MKRSLLCLLFLLFILVLAVSCGHEATSSAVTTAEPSASSPSDSREEGTGQTTEENTAVEKTTEETTAQATTKITEADTTYEDLVYDTSPIKGEVGEPYRIHWNPYLLSPVMEANSEVKEGACAVIKAILNRRLTVKFSSQEVMRAVCDNLFYEFPLTALATLLPDYETLVLSLEYRLGREEHLATVGEFSRTVEAYISETLLFGDSEAVRAIALYHAVSTRVSYMHVDYEPWQTNAYNALVKGLSICYGFADAYRYLLCQVGIEAYIVRSYRSSDKAPHAWTYAKIDGQFYHFDPTWESSMLEGIELYYFGQTDKRRSSLALDDMTVGYGALARKMPQQASSERFGKINGDKFRNGGWIIDREKEVILYKNKEYSFKAEP